FAPEAMSRITRALSPATSDSRAPGPAADEGALPETMSRIRCAPPSAPVDSAVDGTFAAAMLDELARRTGAPTRIALAHGEIDAVVKAVLASPGVNPRPLDEGGLRALLAGASLAYLSGFGAALQ